MRILIISNFYPPYEVGGWEQMSRELTELFQQRGHTVEVLTSTHRVEPGVRPEPGVHRVLALESHLDYYRPLDFFLRWRRNVARNQKLVRQAIGRLDPDIVFIHSMWNLTPAVARAAEQACPERVVYQMCGDWPHAPSAHERYWQSPARHRAARLPRQLLATIALWRLRQTPGPRQLRFRHVLAVSQAIRQELIEKAAIPPENIYVIYNGIDPAPFLAHSRLARPAAGAGPIQLLFAGNLFQHKGGHTVIEALALLPPQPPAVLTILGSGHPDYEAYLHRLVRDKGLEAAVTFRPRVPRDLLAPILGAHDIFVLPSLYEPLARMLQEAMAVGLAVVGTDAWGTREALFEGENGLLFPPEDAAGLARQLARLLTDPALRRQLGAAAQRTVLEWFTLERMVDETEAYLRQVAGDGR